MSAPNGSSTGQEKLPSKKHQLVLIFSIALLVFAVAGVAFQICSVIVGGRYSLVCAGIWCGALYGATGIVGLVSTIRDNNSKLRWILCGFAVSSSISSVVMIAISALGLGDDTVGMLLLWTISNAILIAVGIMGVVVSVTLAIVSRMSFKSNKSVTVHVEMEDIDQKSIESHYLSIPKYPSSDVIAIVRQNETEGSTSTDFYEILESPRPSDKQSSVYATPFRSTKNSSNNSEDFEIQLDNGEHNYSSKNNGVAVHNGWLTNLNLAPSDNKLASSETQEEEEEGWKTIQIPKEDILIHAPPSPNPRDAGVGQNTNNGDIL